MRLGESLRRRRRGSSGHSGPGGPDGPDGPDGSDFGTDEPGGGDPGKPGGSGGGVGWGWPPTFFGVAIGVVPLGMVLAVVGLGGGYLVGTRILFPAPENPTDLIEVPDLSGLTDEMIGMSLEEEGLVLGTVDTLRHPEIPVGVALGQTPLAGQLAVPGDTVRIVISGGPEERPVPDLVGIRADRARDVLDAAGFTFQETTAESDLPAGVVAAMEPRPGTSLALPAEVLLTLSLGPPLVEVPLLVGLPEEEARALADSLGLVVGEVSERFRFGLDQGTVIEQQPAARQMVERGSEVRLVVGRRGTGESELDRDSDSGASAPPNDDSNPREGTRRQP